MPYLSEFKAILFDVDRTINNSKKIVTPATVAALAAIPPEMYKALCTGRILAALDTYIFQYFPEEAIHIISGGAQIVKTTGEVLWEKTIPENLSSSLVKKLLDKNVEFILSQDNKMYATANWKVDLAHGDVPINLADMTSLTTWQTPLISIRRATDDARAIVAQYPELTVKEMPNSSGTTYFDVTAPGVNKATALAKWSELTGIPLEKTIGFGDSSNDIEFLQNVGFPVAMGNSIPELKALAKRVIGHTDDEGLAVYLRQISQGEEL